MHQIDYFDLVLIDGSEFTGIEELNRVYGAKWILLDDIRAFKNHYNYHRLSKDPDYQLIEENHTLRNGHAIFTKNPNENDNLNELTKRLTSRQKKINMKIILKKILKFFS